MKKIIFKKISTDCLKFFLLSILSVSSIIWVLQAVNFLDFVTEDGHGFFVYLNYTLLSFPRIISRLFPFMVFFSVAYILIKYENKNELIIFWNFGISKIFFIGFFIKFSILFLLISLILNALIVPVSQNKAKSFVRSSDLDFFESILKPKKFIDTIKNLTIYFEKKTPEGNFKNLYLKDNSKEEGFQVTISKEGKFEIKNGKKILVLFDGKTISKRNNKLAEFKFSKSDFNIENFQSKTNTYKKTQENSTLELISCLVFLIDLNKSKLRVTDNHIFPNCVINNLRNVYKEIYKRLVMPFYIPLLVMLSLLLILKSKDDHSFKFHKLKIFILGFFLIIFIEISLKFIGINIIKNLLIYLLPLLLFFLMYFYFVNKFKFVRS